MHQLDVSSDGTDQRHRQILAVEGRQKLQHDGFFNGNLLAGFW